jgi:TatD DNase family protein
MILVDVHAHLDFPDYEKDFSEMIEANKKAGVTAIVANGLHVESNRRVLELAKKYSMIKPALGIYPVHVTDMSEEDFDKEVEFIKKSHAVAVGEVGLDYLKGDDNPHGDERKNLMKERFEKFIQISEKKKIPIIVHSRRAELDCIDMLQSSNAKKVIMHCFMGRKHLVKRVVDNGWSLSIPCIINKLQQLQENVAITPTSQLLTETDSPYLSPFAEIRRNEPRFVEGTIRKIAEIKKLDADETANLIYQNYRKMFGV